MYGSQADVCVKREVQETDPERGEADEKPARLFDLPRVGHREAPFKRKRGKIYAKECAAGAVDSRSIRRCPGNDIHRAG